MFSAGLIVVCVRTLNTRASFGKGNTFGLYVVRCVERKDGHWKQAV